MTLSGLGRSFIANQKFLSGAGESVGSLYWLLKYNEEQRYKNSIARWKDEVLSGVIYSTAMQLQV